MRDPETGFPKVVVVNRSGWARAMIAEWDNGWPAVDGHPVDVDGFYYYIFLVSDEEELSLARRFQRFLRENHAGQVYIHKLFREEPHGRYGY